MRKIHPLRRMVLAGAATAGTIVLLLALKPNTDPALAQSPATPTSAAALSPSPTASSSATASPSRTAGKRRASASPSPGRSTSRSASHAPAPTRTSSAPSTPDAPKTTAAAPSIRTVTGATAQTKYGPVQVRITLTDGRITGATAVQSPSSSPRSQEISSTAVPKLNQETLTAQSADIDTVSGATYTSAGYKQSLQSALDKAGV
ncbi:FMN-binding protein [Streptomyces cinnabarinus]|uniref:FMN-binding protein n=1 Tax=Streptomyces cinnabarinus TaxID=67287 RepID=A0ABY7K8N4_9ACTN|nr:FMN-binding protein [Streptomyces cinnabarinus]WAZ19106.1 FMN-binding protein [Streptomyces cinnabarinus]